MPATYVPGISRLIDTSPKKSLPACSRAVCSSNLGFSVPAEITSCEKHSVVVYIHEQWIVVSGTNTIGHGLHVADRAQGLTGTLLHDVMVGE